MPVTFNCPCGRQIRAADEHAGKRVKCPGCEAINLVPAPPAAARSGLLRFRCSCGKTIQARAEHAGKLTRCPSCSAKVRIPVPADTKKSNARADSLPPATKRPPPVRKEEKVEELEVVEEIEKVQEAEEVEEVQEAELVEDAEVIEERPKKQARRAGRSWAVAIIFGGVGLFLLLLLCGGGIALYFYTSTPDDLKYIPDDAQGFESTRLADLWKVDKGKDTAKAHANLLGDNGVDGTGLEISEVERRTTVTWKADNNKPVTWTILLTVSSADKKKIVSRLFKEGATESKYKDKVIVKGEPKYQLAPARPAPAFPGFPAQPGQPFPPGFPLQPGQNLPPGFAELAGLTGVSGPTAVCFVSDRILIVGDQAAIEKALDKYPRNNGDGVITNGVKLAARGGHHSVSGHLDSQSLFLTTGNQGEGWVRAYSITRDNIMDEQSIYTFSSVQQASVAKAMFEALMKSALASQEYQRDPMGKRIVRSIDSWSVTQSGKEVTVTSKMNLSD